MSDIGIDFPPWVIAWFLLGLALPYTTAAVVGLVAALLLIRGRGRGRGRSRLRRCLQLTLLIVGAAWLGGLSVWISYWADRISSEIYQARHHYRLDAAATFAGIAVPQGSWVYVDEAGRLYQIDTDENTAISIDGAKWRGEIRLTLPNERTPSSRGTIQHATLAEDAFIQGIPCRAGGLVEFSNEGRDLLHCTLARRTTVAAEIPAANGEKTTVNLACAADRDIRFRSMGHRLLERCRLATAAQVGSIDCAGGQDIEFDGDGLAACTLGAAQRVGQFDLAPGTPVRFIQGHLTTFDMPAGSPTLTISGIAIPPGSAVQLCDRAPQLDRLLVPERGYVVIDGVKLTGNLGFDCGQFQFGSLFEATLLHGRPSPRGAVISHDDLFSR